MLRRNAGRILITGSIAGFTPGSFQAVYNASKAFLDSFSFALREELRDSGVTVTCLMPGATETEFFRRADMMDTKVGTEKKDDAHDVAKAGFDAMLRGESDIVTGMKNKIQTAVANATPNEVLAKQHRKIGLIGHGEVLAGQSTGVAAAATARALLSAWPHPRGLRSSGRCRNRHRRRSLAASRIGCASSTAREQGGYNGHDSARLARGRARRRSLPCAPRAPGHRDDRKGTRRRYCRRASAGCRADTSWDDEIRSCSDASSAAA